MAPLPPDDFRACRPSAGRSNAGRCSGGVARMRPGSRQTGRMAGCFAGLPEQGQIWGEAGAYGSCLRPPSPASPRGRRKGGPAGRYGGAGQGKGAMAQPAARRVGAGRRPVWPRGAPRHRPVCFLTAPRLCPACAAMCALLAPRSRRRLRSSRGRVAPRGPVPCPQPHSATRTTTLPVALRLRSRSTASLACSSGRTWLTWGCSLPSAYQPSRVRKLSSRTCGLKRA